MRNKILFGIVVLLVPFVVISFKKDKTNFYLEKRKEKKQNIIVRVKDTKTNDIVDMDLEEYLIGVVAAEMPALFHEEAYLHNNLQYLSQKQKYETYNL